MKAITIKKFFLGYYYKKLYQILYSLLQDLGVCDELSKNKIKIEMVIIRADTMDDKEDTMARLLLNRKILMA